MLLLVTYTLLTKNEIIEETLGKIAINFKNKIFAQYVEKKYQVVKMTMGLHKKANRLHYHIGHLVDIGEKNIIHWDKHLRGLIALADSDNSIKEKIDIKISFNNTVEENDITNVLAYPLKEYTSIDEVLHIQDFINLTKNDIESMRQYANGIYKQKCYEKQCKEKKKMETEDNLTSKWKFLDEQLKIEYQEDFMSLKHLEYKWKLTKILHLLLDYETLQHQENDKKLFRVSTLNDVAISYLFYKKLLSNDEIIKYKFNLN